MPERGAEQTMATRWLMRMEEPGWTERHQRALDRWIAGSAERRALFWRLEHGWRAADRVAAVPPAVPPRRGPRRLSLRRPPVRPWGLQGWATAVALAISASLAAVMLIDPALLPRVIPPDLANGQGTAVPRDTISANRYATSRSAQRSVETADGSRIDMAGATRLRTRMAAQQRDVWLEEGEAYFAVRHANNLPFRVHAGGHVVTVLGTRFSVRLHDGTLKVVVFDGRVRVSDPTDPSVPGDDKASANAFDLTRNKVALIEGPTTLITTLHPSQTEARAGQVLIFRDTTLAAALEQFPRYAGRTIVAGDPATAQLTITGRFDSGNVAGFLRLLERSYDVRTNQDADGHVALTKTGS